MAFTGKVISVVGAESTGKSTLALALRQTLGDDFWVVVPEYLREWCDMHKRTPLINEQSEIAATQTARIAAAALHSNVVADTSALMVAVYSQVTFQDASLLATALLQEESHMLTVLCGMDAAWQSGDWQRDGPHMREPVNAALLRALQTSKCRWIQVAGSVQARVARVMMALQ